MTASPDSLPNVIAQVTDAQRPTMERLLAAATARHMLDQLLPDLVEAARAEGNEWVTLDQVLILTAAGARHVEDFGSHAQLIFDRESGQLRRQTAEETASFGS